MMESPFERRQKGRKIGHNGRVAENKFADRIGGRVTPGSGNQLGAKGDVTVHNFLIENKATQTATMSVQLDWLLKIYQEALEKNRTPALAIQFTNEAGHSGKRERWVMLPESVFNELIDPDK